MHAQKLSWPPKIVKKSVPEFETASVVIDGGGKRGGQREPCHLLVSAGSLHVVVMMGIERGCQKRNKFAINKREDPAGKRRDNAGCSTRNIVVE